MDNREHLIENALICYEEDKDFEYYASNENNQYMAEQYGIKLEDVWIMACNVIYNWKPDWIYQGKEEKWISVKDGLPYAGVDYIVSTKEYCDETGWTTYATMEANFTGKEWVRNNCNEPCNITNLVTHWKPLPEPAESPKEE